MADEERPAITLKSFTLARPPVRLPVAGAPPPPLEMQPPPPVNSFQGMPPRMPPRMPLDTPTGTASSVLPVGMNIPAIVRPTKAQLVPDERIEQARKLGWVQLPTPDGQSWTWYHPHTGAHIDMATLDASQVSKAVEGVIKAEEMDVPSPSEVPLADSISAQIAKKREQLLARQKLEEATQRIRDEQLRKIEEERKRIEGEREKERIRVEGEKEQDNLRRLPPGLRARLLKRGIIKNPDVEKKKQEEKRQLKEERRKCAEAKNEKVDSEPGTPSGSSDEEVAPPPPRLEDPLPEGWAKAAVGAETFYWNTVTNTSQWERPSDPARKCKEPASSSGHGKKYAHEQVVGVVETDISRLIGKKGSTVHVLKAALGDCQINFPKKGEAPVSVALNGKALYPVKIYHNDARMAKKGKKAIDIFLGYARTMEFACSEAGVKAVTAEEEKAEPAKAKAKGKKRKQEPDMMDPAAYSDAPKGNWSRGLEQQRKRLEIG